jgi:hypothetical protein
MCMKLLHRVGEKFANLRIKPVTAEYYVFFSSNEITFFIRSIRF